MVSEASSHSGAPASFSHVRFWIFDLDNTLYPASCELFPQIDLRMRQFIVERFGLSPEEARGVQKRYYHEYGTTLRGLMDHHGVNPTDFLQYVHDIDYQVLRPRPKLGEALRALPGRKAIYTNGSERHVACVLERLGLAECFDGVFDIVAAGFVPKPERRAYETMARALGVDFAHSAMFEDIARNLVPAHAVGMKTVLVRCLSGSPELPEGDLSWIDCETSDLSALLSGLS